MFVCQGSNFSRSTKRPAAVRPAHIMRAPRIVGAAFPRAQFGVWFEAVWTGTLGRRTHATVIRNIERRRASLA